MIGWATHGRYIWHYCYELLRGEAVTYVVGGDARGQMVGVCGSGGSLFLWEK